ncbi:MAG TPA: glutathione S-transferase N-terminal domain-containing protein [Polyangiaceae bacterium]
MGRAFDVVTSSAATVARLGSGLAVHHSARAPEKRLELYDFEACPFCRKTREALTALDLEALIKPCPKGGARFRPGKKQFPFLVDPNTGAEMYESMDIARYLAKTYGDGSLPFGLRLGPVTTLSSSIASAFRAGHGGAARKSTLPEKPLDLWSFESSPYCRLAREALCELEIPYVLHNVGKRSRWRKDFVARSGKMMVPYLVDDNTGKAMFESGDIVRYLSATYSA